MENSNPLDKAPAVEWEQVRNLINKGRMSRLQVLAIMLCVLLNAVDGFDLAAMVFTASSISAHWNLSSAELGVLLGLAPAGMVFGAFVLAPVADIIGRRKAIVLGLVLACLGMFLGAYSQSYHEFAASRILTGLGVGGIIPGLSVIVAEYASDKWRGGSISLLGVGVMGGAMMGGAVVNALLENYEWRSAFLVGGLLTFTVLIVVLIRLPESIDFLVMRRPRNALRRLNRQLLTMRHEQLCELPVMANHIPSQKSRRPNVRSLVTGEVLPRTLKLWGIEFLATASMFFVMSWTPRLLVLSGLSESDSIIGGIILNAGGLAGCLLFGLLAARANFKRVTLAYFLMGACALIAFSVLHQHLMIAYVLTFFIGLCAIGALAGVNTLAPSLYPVAVRGTGVGFAAGIGAVGSISSPVLTGVLLDMNQQSSSLYLYCAALLLCAALLMWSLRHAESSLSSQSTHK